ncbi:hypothetical protein ACFQZC_04715 [Streptacidiphilus monticola]
MATAVWPSFFASATRASRRATEPRTPGPPLSLVSSRVMRASSFGTRRHRAFAPSPVGAAAAGADEAPDEAPGPLSA